MAYGQPYIRLKTIILIFLGVFLSSTFHLLEMASAAVSRPQAVEEQHDTIETAMRHGVSAIVRPHQDKTQRSRFSSTEIIVKFKSEGRGHLRQCAHCLLAQKQPFQEALSDHSDSVDRLNEQIGVRSGRPLFMERHSETTAEAKRKSNSQIALAKNRFPLRTERIQTTMPPPPALYNIYALEVPEGTDIAHACKLFEEDPHVEYAQPSYKIEAQWVPDDPYYHSAGSWGQAYDDLWALKVDKLNLAAAWEVAKGEGVVVAVVDTGVDYTHADITDNIWKNMDDPIGDADGDGDPDDDHNGYSDDVMGWDFVTCDSVGFEVGSCLDSKPADNDPIDDNGHGTHVAGIVAAVGNNGQGIVGVAPEAQIMAIKGLNIQSIGTDIWLAQGMVYAAMNGADILNNSWACPCITNPLLEDAVRTVYSLGVVTIFSAGNGAIDVSEHSPQNMTNPKPIVVSATDHLDFPTGFTNYGSLVDIAAPGGGRNDNSGIFYPRWNILSLRADDCSQTLCLPELEVGGGYLRMAGTSVAAPHAAGVAALLLTLRPEWGHDDIRHALRASANDSLIDGFHVLMGSGRLDAAEAVKVNNIPQIKIISPVRNRTFNPRSGSVTIYGQAAGETFEHYRLSYGVGFGPVEWRPIGDPVWTPVEQRGALGAWAVSKLPVAPYLLRLEVMTIDGHVFDDVVQVGVEVPPRRITAELAEQWSVAISGPRIVWEDFRNGDSDIYMFDLETQETRPIASAVGDQSNPAISGDKIVWEDKVVWDDLGSGSSQIYCYDLENGEERQITSGAGIKTRPQISGHRIIWQDLRNGNGDIYLYDLERGEETRITTDPSYQFLPSISGNYIVWTDGRTGNDDIFLYDLTTGKERQITDNPSTQWFPAISGDWIVWLDYRDGDQDLHYYHVVTGEEGSIESRPHLSFPSVSQNYVVWGDFENGDADIYVFDLVTKRKQAITGHPSYQSLPAISGRNVVWEDFRNNNHDIYLGVVPRTATRTRIEQFLTEKSSPVRLLRF